ncbi:MAG: hypothetical protein Q8880_13640, partial [Bacteroidota bacterium]|nr:hypothetical protein [Bacteroidota bacterium]
GNYDLTLSQTTADIYFTNGSADTLTKIVTDGAGKGYLYKQFPAGLFLPSYTFPIAGSTSTSDYSPAIITFASNTTAGLVGARVTNSTDLQLAKDYLKKYWSFKSSGLSTYSYTADFKYSLTDTVGNQNNYKICQFNASKGWTEYTTQSTVNTTTQDLSFTATMTNVADSLNMADYTGGRCPTLFFETTKKGKWNDPSIWSLSTDSLFQNPTGYNTSYPPNASNSSGILVLDSVTLTSGIAIDQTVIAQGVQLSIQPGVTLTVNDGSGKDLNVYGAVDNLGTISNMGSIYVKKDAFYIHDQNGGSVPQINWETLSNCELKSSGTAPSGLNQNFSNFIYNSSGNFVTLSNDLNVLNSLIITAGTINASNRTINVSDSINGTGNLSFTSGTLNIGGDYYNTGSFTCGTGTVNYISNNSFQAVKGTTYYKLNIKGSHAKYINGDITVNAPFNLVAPDSLFSENIYSTCFNITFNDSVHCTGSLIMPCHNTVTYNSNIVNQNIIPALYWNFTKSGTAIANQVSALDVMNDFTISSGTYDCNNFDLTLDGNATNVGGTFLPGNNTVTYASMINPQSV